MMIIKILLIFLILLILARSAMLKENSVLRTMIKRIKRIIMITNNHINLINLSTKCDVENKQRAAHYD